MRILGVDPGTLAVGFGVVETNGGDCRAVEFGCVRLSAKVAFVTRLKRIYQEISQVIVDFNPDEFAIEDVFYAENVKVALKMGHARGVVLLAAANHNVPTYEYSPREIKQSIVGNGAASKQQVQRMLQNLLSLKSLPEPLDASDALAAAMCHSHRTGSQI